MIKPSLHQHCLDLLQSKMATLEQAIADAQQAASEDTKSSAGDKFETSREMIKQEINKNSQQLSQLNKMLLHLQQLKPELAKDRVGQGSLVIANEGRYYFSVGLGKVVLEGETYFALSMASPIAQALQGREAGEIVRFRGREIQIEEVQ